MHQHHDPNGHIPAPDLPRHRTMLGFRPHIFVGGLVLIALLIMYLLLMMHPRAAAPTPTKPSPASSSAPIPNR